MTNENNSESACDDSFTMLEGQLLERFSKQSQHLKLLPADEKMQLQLFEIASPFHEKLKEYGYTPAESRAILRRAFGHNPPKPNGEYQKLDILGER